MQRFQDDRWNTTPPSITTFLSYPNTPGSVDTPVTSYTSPICGFGWGFRFARRHLYLESTGNPHVQELTGRVGVVFQPRACSGIRLKDVSICVRAKFPLKEDNNDCKTLENHYDAISLSAERAIGTYIEPFQLGDRAFFEITLTFNRDDHLAFPTTNSSITNVTLTSSLDGLSPIDTKFYLYSAKVKGRPGQPRAVFANGKVVSDSSTYVRDLISGGDLQGGVACDLDKDVPDALLKLDAGTYDYDSDSDLESLPGDPEPGASVPLATRDISEEGDSKDQASSSTDPASVGTMLETSLVMKHGQARVQGHGKALAVNGTAYQTWKAFVFYAYTNEVHFNSLKSEGVSEPQVGSQRSQGPVRCSPKSMYRLADYTGMKTLKDVSRAAIRRRLSKKNIVRELFSTFTSRYEELIELEVEFLVNNLSPGIAREFDDILKPVVLGVKPHCQRALAYSIRRMRGEKPERVWAALNCRDLDFEPGEGDEERSEGSEERSEGDEERSEGDEESSEGGEEPGEESKPESRCSSPSPPPRKPPAAAPINKSTVSKTRPAAKQLASEVFQSAPSLEHPQSLSTTVSKLQSMAFKKRG